LAVLLLAVMLVTPAAACGNGVLAAPETCDDGNVISGDGCTSTCTIESGCTCNAAVGALSSCDCDDDNLFGNSNDTWWWLLALLLGGLCLLALLAAGAYFLMNSGNNGGGYGPFYRSGGSSPLSPGIVAPGAPPVPVREFTNGSLVNEDKASTMV